MKVSCGNLEVLHGGIINSVLNDDTVITFDGDPSLVLTIKVNRAITEEIIKFEPTGKVTANLIITGASHDNYGHASPMEIGNYQDRRLYISLRITTFENPGSYTLIYTIYLGEEI